MRQLRRLFPRHKLSQAVTGRRGRRPLRSGRTFPRRGDSRIARRPAPMSDQRATTRAERSAGRPYGADGRFPQIPNSEFISPCDSCDSCDGFSPVTSCRKPSRAVEGAGPYDADPRFPVGTTIGRPPTCTNVRPTGRRGRPPLRSGRRFPVGATLAVARRPAPVSDQRAGTSPAPTERTEVPRRGDPCGRPPICANVRQAGRRGRRPLRCGRRFPRRGGAKCPSWVCPSRRQARTSDQRAGQARPLRSGWTFPRKFQIPNSEFRIHLPPLRILSSLFTFYSSLPPCDSCDSCDGFSPVASCHGPSRAPAPTERTDVSPQIPNSAFQIPNSEFRIPNSAFISRPCGFSLHFSLFTPPCDSCDGCDGFTPVASCHKLSRAVAPGRICDETVNGFSENARKMIETKKTLCYNT